MNGISDAALWSAIAALGFGTWLIRFSFIGFLGGREMPDWAIRLLRFVPVTVLPAMAAPLVVRPGMGGRPGIGGEPGASPSPLVRADVRPNNIFADRNGKVYRQTLNGWQEHSRDGWSQARSRPCLGTPRRRCS